MDGVHDMGGMHGFGPVRTPGGELTHHEAWETRAQVVALLAGAARRADIEALDPAVYLSSSYYVRWLRTAEKTLVESGRIDAADLQRWRDAFAADPDLAMPTASAPSMVELIQTMGPHVHCPVTASAFSVGDRVRVRRMRPASHHRCPRYLRGAAGEVERICGTDAHPGDGRPEPVYTVRFTSTDLFGPPDPDRDAPPHRLYIDLWERYLEAP